MSFKVLLNLIVALGVGLGLAVLVAGVSTVHAQGPLDTTFTYQGRLLKSNTYVFSDTCDFQFSLYDHPTVGTQQGGTQTLNNVPVSNGYFTVDLDFGDVFTNSKRYLAIAVQCTGDAGYTALSPRVTLNVAPYSTYSLYAQEAGEAGAVDWGNVTNKPPGFADDEDGLDTFVCASGEILQSTGAGGWICEEDPTDHGKLDGLNTPGDDDHPQYLKDAGDTLKGNLDADNNYRIRKQLASASDGDSIVHGQAASGDLGDEYPGPTVVALQSNPITSTAPLTGEVLTWDGVEWIPADVVLELHNHFGQEWTGNDTYGLRVQNSDPNGTGFRGDVTATSGTNYGVFGSSSSPAGSGVYGEALATSGGTYGVHGKTTSPSGTGVYGEATATTSSAIGVHGQTSAPSGKGVYGQASASSGVTYGVYGDSNSAQGYGGYFVNQSSGVALKVVQAASVNDQPVFEVWATAADREFYVDSDGDVFADGGYKCGVNIDDVDLFGGAVFGQRETSLDPCLQDNAPADFAEMLPTAETTPLEPGDVLVIDGEGRLTRSDVAYQPNVIGVYSTRPSFLGNAQFANEAGYAPLAVVGVVPVKATLENGPIQPGDMLTTSSTPGHAMRCEGVESCFGRSIGKALSGLETESGQIQMLVMLQ
jgi:hypothetical protein